MGRVFGVFLLIFGIGLAAHGLPSTDAEWSPAIERLARSPSSTGGSAGAATVPHAAVPAEIRGSARSASSESGFKSRAVERAPAPEPGIAGIGPMDKLKAAGQARVGAVGETTAIHKPSSSTSRLDVVAPVPTPVEIVRSGAPRTPPSVAAPTVVATAKRESALRERSQDSGNGKPLATGPTTNAVGAGPAQGAPTASTAPIGAASPAPVRTVTLSLSPTLSPASSPGSRPSTQAQAPSAEARLLAPSATQQDSTAPALGKLAAPMDVAKPAGATKPRVEANARQLLNQRYAPPAFLGKVAQPVVTREAQPHRSFKAQDFWESSRRSGL